MVSFTKVSCSRIAYRRGIYGVYCYVDVVRTIAVHSILWHISIGGPMKLGPERRAEKCYEYLCLCWEKESYYDLGLVSSPGSGERFSGGCSGGFWGAQPQTTFADAPDAGNLGKSRHVSRAPHPRAPGTGSPARCRRGCGGEFSVRHCVIQRQPVSAGTDEPTLAGSHHAFGRPEFFGGMGLALCHCRVETPRVTWQTPLGLTRPSSSTIVARYLSMTCDRIQRGRSVWISHPR